MLKRILPFAMAPALSLLLAASGQLSVSARTSSQEIFCQRGYHRVLGQCVKDYCQKAVIYQPPPAGLFEAGVPVIICYALKASPHGWALYDSDPLISGGKLVRGSILMGEQLPG